MKRCEVCNKPIRGSYKKALGNYYHLEHFKCSICGKKIEGSFYKYQGEPAHADCYERKAVPKCDICGEPLTGKRYITDRWHNKICAKHRNEYEKCPYCESFMAHELQTKKHEYPDGRAICSKCKEKAVDDKDLASLIFRELSTILSKYDIEVDPEPLNLRLVSKDTLEAQVGKGSRGSTEFNEVIRESLIGGRDVRRNFTVSLFYGLPDFEFKTVGAHELMHVWIYENTPYKDPSRKERFIEGSCDYASYLVLKYIGNEFTELKLRKIKEKPDEVYGEGFRLIKKYVDEKGIKSWLDRLKNGIKIKEE